MRTMIRKGVLGALVALLAIFSWLGMSGMRVFAADGEAPTAVEVTSVDKPAIWPGSGYVYINVYFSEEHFLSNQDIPDVDKSTDYNVLDAVSVNGKTLRMIETEGHPDWVVVNWMGDQNPEGKSYLQIRLEQNLGALGFRSTPGYGTTYQGGNHSYGGNEVRIDESLIFPSVQGSYALAESTWLSFYIDAWQIDTEAGDFSSPMSNVVTRAKDPYFSDATTGDQRYLNYEFRFEDPLYPAILQQLLAGTDWVRQNHYPHMTTEAYHYTEAEIETLLKSGIRRSFYDHLLIDCGDGKGYRSAGALMTEVLNPGLLHTSLNILFATDGSYVMRITIDRQALPQFATTDQYVSFRFEEGLKFPSMATDITERFTNGRSLVGDATVTFNADTDALEALLAEAQELNRSDYTTESWNAFANAFDAATGMEDGTQEEIDAAAAALEDAMEALVRTKPVSASFGESEVRLAVGTALDLTDWTITVTYDNNRTKSVQVTEQMLSSAADSVVTPAYDADSIGRQTVYIVYAEEGVTVSAQVTLVVTNDRTALAAAIAAAEEKTETDYSAASWEALQTALTAAKAVNTESAAQTAIDEAAEALEQAVEALQARVLTGIELTKTTVTTAQGTEPDFSGIQVKKTYDNGFTEQIALTESMLSAYDVEEAGEQTITVTIEENGVSKTATLTLQVEEKTDGKEPENPGDTENPDKTGGCGGCSGSASALLGILSVAVLAAVRKFA